MNNANVNNGAERDPENPTAEETLKVTRHKVRDLLLRSEAFREMPPEKQREIANNTVAVANYLARPEGIPATRLPTARQVQAEHDNYAFPLADANDGSGSRRGGRGNQEFTALAAREGAAVAGELLREVNFPEFVAGLITGVFDSIVDSSIKQMEAYGELVASVAQSLNQFRDENVTANQGRDHLVEQFPDTFMLDLDTGSDPFGGGGGPRVRLREGVDERAALQQVNNLPMEGGPLKSLDMEDDEIEQKVVQAARTQLATSRQQLLATMVLMGINRIIVTDGRISAKVLYNFSAKDSYKASATSFDYQNLGTQTTSEGEFETEREGASYEGTYSRDGDKSEGEYERRGGKYYASGNYKRTTAPLVKLSSASASATDAALTSRAALAGNVEVNFRSESFPLEKMADSFQIGQITNASRPGAAKAAAAQRTSGNGSQPTTDNAQG